MISARTIAKRDGPAAVLADVSFDVAPGECVAITGPAGSGRTTLLHIVATLVQPTSGTLTIGGIDTSTHLHDARRRIAYADDVCAAGSGLRVAEYLRWILHTRGDGASIEHTRRVRDALAAGAIDSARPVDSLESAQRLLVSVAAALMVRPDVLVVDGRACASTPARSFFLDCVSDALVRRAALVVLADDVTALDGLRARELRVEGGRLASDGMLRDASAAMEHV